MSWMVPQHPHGVNFESHVLEGTSAWESVPAWIRFVFVAQAIGFLLAVLIVLAAFVLGAFGGSA